MSTDELLTERIETATQPQVRGRRRRDGFAVHLPARIEDFIAAEQWAVFGPALHAVARLGVPHAIGGGLATSLYTGHWRNSKDIDVYVLREQRDAVIRAVLQTGLRDYFDELPYDRAWLFRAVRDGVIVDIMWALANGADDVEPAWLARGSHAQLHGQGLRLLAPEELFWSKVHVLQRDRCDWPDLLNLLYATGPEFDWSRVVQRMASHERLLASVLSLFAWIAPGRAALLPEWLWERLRLAVPDAAPARCDEHIRLLDTRDWFTTIDPSR